MVAIGWKEYLVAMALGFLIIPIVEVIKVFSRMIDKKKNR